MTLPTVSLVEVQARWAYSEIVDGTLSHIYENGPNLDALRDKRTRGVPIEGLTPGEQYNLAFLCVMARPNMMIFMTGVDCLIKRTLNRKQIAEFLVPQMVSGHSDFMSFENFLNTTASGSKDARNVQPPLNGYQASADPLTAGIFFGHPALLDGYHRAALFWKFAHRDAIIEVYLPRQFVSAA